ncbi:MULTISPECIES: AAA domain-containing protein [unclassified Xanthobacter]|uniref:AAA domain-containing protein n=1 Tax=unclassified Xanthobacter TaxID=2623496 RepID=UPI001EDFD216|nr:MULTISPECIES: AAA domain-containing protein [unclassified Xanthobacter]
MQVTNCGRGVHVREVKGVDRLRALPRSWYAFTNLELATGIGRSREIDVIMVTDHVVFLIDLKDWSGKIESDSGNWLHNGRDTGPSPVAKINANEKDVLRLLTSELRRRPESASAPVPKIVGVVVITGKADVSGIAATERGKVFAIDDFLRIAGSEQARRATFGNVAPQIVATPLTDAVWKARFASFLNVKAGPFKPGRLRYDRYVATSDQATFQHPADIYREYEAEEENTPQNLGTLRLWNFANCTDGRFQTEEGRAEIAGREGKVFYYLRDRSEDCENWILVPKAADPNQSVNYWEVYDRRRRLKRLRDFVSSEAANLSPQDRVELARQLLARVKALHMSEAAHLDLGSHSVWLEAPSTVRISHLLAAKFPEVASLGKARYQFLSTVTAPEDVLGDDFSAKTKDVFLAAVAVHEILFGRPPASPSPGNPPDWNAAIDGDLTFEPLHRWFANALEIDPASRFPDAGAALEAFNAATASRPTPKEVIEGLDRFRGSIRSQRQLFGSYPAVADIASSDIVEMWRSARDGSPVKVKMWKRQAWGDQARESARILDFLNRALDLKLSPPPGCTPVRDVLWLGDAIVLVQDWIEGETLTGSLASTPGTWHDPHAALTFLARLATIVMDLHARGAAHGDLKPDNIIVREGESPEPVLVDTIDFAPARDGDIVSNAYAPDSGSRQERDNFAVTKIVEEVLARSAMEAAAAASIATAIATCRDRVPRNATLSPLAEALDAALTPCAEAPRLSIALSIRGAETGPLFPDEGRVYLRAGQGIAALFIRGSGEEIEIRLDVNGVPRSGRRRPVNQGWIARIAKYEFKSIPADITVERSDLNDFEALAGLLEDADVREALGRARTPGRAGAPDDDAPADQEELGDVAEDTLVEEIAAASPAVRTADTDVPALWRSLMDAEAELTTEGVALSDAFFDRNLRRHVVPFELSSGTFDFDRADKVGVEKLDTKGIWRRVGELDTARSKLGVVVIDPTEYANPHQARIIEENQRLRFTSHFELQSLRRREGAIEKMLSRTSRVPGLIDVFDPRKRVLPVTTTTVLDAALVDGYGLNPSQKEALGVLLGARPLGLLQGPPGTGKTKFIAALTHYALAKGLARNVLLASQSHEAVNNAAEAVLALFRRSGGEPSILRVGAEGVVSDRLLPYHTGRAELSFKDRFRAQHSERLHIAGAALGLPEGLVEDLLFVESAVRPVCARMAALASDAEADPSRVDGLRQTLRAHLSYLGLPEELPGPDSDVMALVDSTADALVARRKGEPGVSAASAARLRTVSRIARDFVTSASTAQRSFEPFLAGTRQIVAGTCVGLGRPSLGLTSTPFDLVIVDEAARCTASELSVPLQAGRWIILVGDQAQLEPLHKPEVVQQVGARAGFPKGEIVRSDFARVFETAYGAAAGKKLKTQYRMLPPIGRLVSDTFYPEIDLEHGRDTPEVPPGVLPDDLGVPLTWIATDSLGEQGFESPEAGGTSRSNRVEADCILTLLTGWYEHEPFRNWLTTQAQYPHGIGVICMYAAQRDHLRSRILKTPHGDTLLRHVKIDTVDSYQGKENPIVILSLVRNNADGIQQAGVATVREGFLSRSNRINVAVSRAMDRLVIVGGNTRWRQGGPMRRLADNFAKALTNGEAVMRSASDVVSAATGTPRGKKTSTGG